MTNFIGKSYIDKNLCDDLIDYFESSDKKFKGTFLIGKGHDEDYDPKKKDTTEIHFKPQDTILFDTYMNELNKCLEKYKKEYIYCDEGQEIWGLEPWPKIQRYKPKQGYHIWHNENAGSKSTYKRHLVFMTYLNTVTSGGETGFWDQKVKIKPKKGLTLIWPATWTHTHKGYPPVKQNKYIVTGWWQHEGI